MKAARLGDRALASFPRHRPWLRRAVAGTAVASLAVVVAGCGIPAETTPRAISGPVPFHLLTRQPPATTSTTTPPYSTAVTVYFTVTFQRYVAPVTRNLPPKVTPTSIIEALLGGPNPVQVDNGYSSALTKSVRLIRASVSGGLATVDFNNAFGQISGNAPLAVAQVVYTITANLKTVSGVVFQIENFTIPVPSPTGVLVNGPVTASAYSTLVSPSPTSPSS